MHDKSSEAYLRRKACYLWFPRWQRTQSWSMYGLNLLKEKGARESVPVFQWRTTVIAAMEPILRMHGSRGNIFFSLNRLWDFKLIYLNRFISMIQQWVFRLIGYNIIISMIRTLDIDSWECHRVESYVNEFTSYIHTWIFTINLVKEIAHNPCIHACTLSIHACILHVFPVSKTRKNGGLSRF